MIDRKPRFLQSGDTAITIELPGAPGMRQSSLVLALYDRISRADAPGVIELVPALSSLTVHYDPVITSSAALTGLLAGPASQTILESHPNPAAEDATEEFDPDAHWTPPARNWLLPACYEPDFAVDLHEIASRCGLSPWQVTALHACVAYRVLTIGFLPGHPYMGDLPPPLCIPRRNHPRTSVPEGSIAIANTMSVIYPMVSPGGWNILARTPVRLFDATRDAPSLLAPGDEVRFEPIDAVEFARLSADAIDGWTPSPLDHPA